LMYRVFGSRLLMGLAIARFARARLARWAAGRTAGRPRRPARADPE
jgi:hypothetical protein